MASCPRTSHSGAIGGAPPGGVPPAAATGTRSGGRLTFSVTVPEVAAPPTLVATRRSIGPYTLSAVPVLPGAKVGGTGVRESCQAGLATAWARQAGTSQAPMKARTIAVLLMVLLIGLPPWSSARFAASSLPLYGAYACGAF